MVPTLSQGVETKKLTLAVAKTVPACPFGDAGQHPWYLCRHVNYRSQAARMLFRRREEF
jgi:hypothetical protein